MKSMQKAKKEFDSYVEAPEEEEDDMEQYFLDTINNELTHTEEYEEIDQYTAALDKLEEIKKNQKDILPHADKIADGDQEYSDLEDDMETRLMDDICQSLKDELNEENKYQDNKTDFEIEYEELIQEFSIAINSKKRKSLNLEKITELANRVWALIDEWRNQDPQITEK